jgi:MFS family permease
MRVRLEAVTAYAAFSSRDFRFQLIATTLSMFAQQMLATVVGWDLYLSTHSPVVLGNVGLVQIIPVLLFTFVAGHVADRYNRSRTAMVTQVAQALVAFALAGAGSGRGVVLIYAALFLTATARAFQWPATSAMLPQTVPPESLTQAISWSGSAREMATMGGPALAGALIAAFGSEAVYIGQAICCVLSAICFAMMRVPDRAEHERPEIGLKAVAEGIRFVWREKVILSAMSLDLLAVFFGGATALLPIYAADILRIGATGLGWLRAAPAVGAGLTAIWIAHQPPIRHAGLVLLATIAAFGAATIGFAVSTSAWLSFGMLFLTGAFDSVSVVLRISLVQSRTPDALRGRVSAVNGLFISASNQWGAVESGVAAALMGTVPSVVFGGAATIVVVAAVGALSTSMRRWKN